MTQETLAFETGISKRSIEKAEAGGVISLNTLSALCAALDCDPQDLIVAELPTAVEEHLTSVPLYQKELCRKFRLRHCVVINLSASREQIPRGAMTAVYDNNDAFIHVALGCAAARVVGSLLSAGQTIGIGGGRTPKSCVHYLGGLESLPTCKILSLSGHVSTHSARGATPSAHDEHTDADTIASSLGNVLHDSEVTGVNSPLAGRSSRAARRPKLPRAAVVLIGVGILTPAHPLAQFEGNSDLELIAGDLKKLFSIVKDPHAAGVVIGDVCNYLFRVAPIGKSGLEKEIDNVLKRINRQTVTLRLDVLARVCKHGHVVLVAGGLKAPAIKHLLQQSPPYITHLVTDDFAGNLLHSDIDQ